MEKQHFLRTRAKEADRACDNQAKGITSEKEGHSVVQD